MSSHLGAGSVGLLAALYVASSVAAQTPDTAALLRRSDVGGFVPGSFRARMSMRQESEARASEVELWRSGSERTLVRMLDKGERGKFLLRLGSDLWFLTPTAKQPIKLSPTHRIYGAATLDVLLGTRLSDDYRIARATTEPPGGIVVFDLEARSASLPFATVRYAVDATTERPVSALYRLRSGRDATRVEFFDWTGGGKNPRYAKRIHVRDMLRKGALTTIDVIECEERAIADGLFDLTNSAARQALK